MQQHCTQPDANFSHTPDVVFDDDMDRQSATCVDCRSELVRHWLPLIGGWSDWLRINARSQVPAVL